MSDNISFFSEDVDFNLQEQEKINEWILKVISNEHKNLTELNFIFCSDEYLKQINIDYLDHHYFTDIITFDNSDAENEIEGDIFISIDRVKENSQDYNKTFEDELHRVIIHGVLHLIGYDDKEESSQKLMREKEDTCLSLYSLL